MWEKVDAIAIIISTGYQRQLWDILHYLTRAESTAIIISTGYQRQLRYPTLPDQSWKYCYHQHRLSVTAVRYPTLPDQSWKYCFHYQHRLSVTAVRYPTLPDQSWKYCYHYQHRLLATAVRYPTLPDPSCKYCGLKYKPPYRPLLFLKIYILLITWKCAINHMFEL